MQSKFKTEVHSNLVKSKIELNLSFALNETCGLV